MNTHLADEPVEVKMLVEVQVGETPISPALPQALPYYSTSYLGPKPLECCSKVEKLFAFCVCCRGGVPLYLYKSLGGAGGYSWHETGGPPP